MKELDVLLTRYLDNVYPEATAEEQRGFERMLAMQDPELYACLTGRDRVDDEEIDRVIQRIRRDTGL
jgi:antitoxin CptB